MMESIHTVLNLVTPNCWMASLDCKKTYYSVKIHPDFKKTLKSSLTKAPFTSAQPSKMVHAPAQESLQ